MSNTERRPPEGSGPASVDQQGYQPTCVRAAVSKAITNHLFDKNMIEVDQQQVMISLIQITKSTCALSPLKYDGVELVLQDIKYQKDPKDLKSVTTNNWWKFKIRVNEEQMKSDYDIDYDEDKQYVLGYSTSLYEKERSKHKDKKPITEKEAYCLRKNPEQRKKTKDGHCVYIRQRYISLSKNDPKHEIYECINSQGFTNHSPCIRINSPSIVGIFQIIIEKPVLMKSNDHGPGCNCKMSKAVNCLNCGEIDNETSPTFKGW